MVYEYAFDNNKVTYDADYDFVQVVDTEDDHTVYFEDEGLDSLLEVIGEIAQRRKAIRPEINAADQTPPTSIVSYVNGYHNRVGV